MMKATFIKLSALLAFSACLGLLPADANAYTAIASIAGYITDTFNSSSNYDTQKEADSAALEGCRTEARKHGLGKLAAKCQIQSRAKGAGYGAVVCGSNGCHWVTGYASIQQAVDAAYDGCAKDFQQCDGQNVTNWEDFAGFPQRRDTPKVADGGDCRPRKQPLVCNSSCDNGSCLVKYENGCQMEVQVHPRLDPFTQRWVYPTPSC